MLISAILYPLHLFLVNLAAGLPLIGLGLHWSGRRREGIWRAHVKLIHLAWISLLVGALIGTIHGALVWNSEWSRKIELAGSRIGFAGIEFLTSLVMFIAYAFWLQRRQSHRRLVWEWIRWLVLLIAGTNLLYHFPVLFGVLDQIDIADYVDRESMTAEEFRAIIFSLPVVSGWVHFTLSALAISAIIAMLGVRREDASERAICRRLAWVSLSATSLQWISGPAVFVNLTRTSQIALTGGETMWTAWMGQTLVMVFVLFIVQIQLAIRPETRRAATVLALQAYVVFAMSWVQTNWP